MTRIEFVFVRRRQVGIGVLAEVPRFHVLAPAVASRSACRNCRTFAAVPSRLLDMRHMSGLRDRLDPRIRERAPRSARDIRPTRGRRLRRAGTAPARSTRCSRCLSLGLCMYGSQVSSASVSRLRATMVSSSSGIVARSAGFLSGSWKSSRSSLLLRHREHVGMSSLSARADLDADRTDQHEAADPLRHLGGDLGRDPAADRAADQSVARQAAAGPSARDRCGRCRRRCRASPAAPTCRSPDATARSRAAPSRAVRERARRVRCRRRRAGRGSARPGRARTSQARRPRSRSCYAPYEFVMTAAALCPVSAGHDNVAVRSDHRCRAQLSDFALVVSELRQHRVGVLAQCRRRQGALVAGAVDQHRAMDGGDLAFGRMGCR